MAAILQMADYNVVFRGDKKYAERDGCLVPLNPITRAQRQKRDRTASARPGQYTMRGGYMVPVNSTRPQARDQSGTREERQRLARQGTSSSGLANLEYFYRHKMLPRDMASVMQSIVNTIQRNSCTADIGKFVGYLSGLIRLYPEKASGWVGALKSRVHDVQLRRTLLWPAFRLAGVEGERAMASIYTNMGRRCELVELRGTFPQSALEWRIVPGRTNTQVNTKFLPRRIHLDIYGVELYLGSYCISGNADYVYGLLDIADWQKDDMLDMSFEAQELSRYVHCRLDDMSSRHDEIAKILNDPGDRTTKARRYIDPATERKTTAREASQRKHTEVIGARQRKIDTQRNSRRVVVAAVTREKRRSIGTCGKN